MRGYRRSFVDQLVTALEPAVTKELQTVLKEEQRAAAKVKAVAERVIRQRPLEQEELVVLARIAVHQVLTGLLLDAKVVRHQLKKK